MKTQSKYTPGLAIRFDGPPGPESCRFVELEVDGQSVGMGSWEDQGDGTWLLVLGPLYSSAPDLLEAAKLGYSALDRGATMPEEALRILGCAITKAEEGRP